MKNQNIVNQKFGFWSVLEIKNNTYCICKCICGIVKEVKIYNLLNNKSVSCGCRKALIISDKNKKNEPRLSSAKAVYSNNNCRYSDGNISFEDFLILSQKNCYYCGSPPSNNFNKFKNRSTIPESIINGEFIYNGLDRIDSTKPHLIDNVVPCCSICNYAKSNLSIDDFKNWLLKISCKFLFDIDPNTLNLIISKHKGES